MACVQIDVPDRRRSDMLEEWADLLAADGQPVESEWYRMKARELRAVTDADVLRSQHRGDRVPVQKDSTIPGSSMFMCGRGLKPDVLCGCGAFAGFLCDKPMGAGKTCDLGICDRCRIPGTNGRQKWDYCPRH